MQAVAGSLAAPVVALMLVAGLGSEPAQEAAADSSRGLWPLAVTLTDFPRWTGGEAHRLEPGLDWAVAAKIGVLAVVVFLLALLAGRSRSVAATLLAGWGGFVVACGVAGAAYFLVAEARDVQMASLVGEMNAGASFGLYTGLLVGAAVALARPRDRAMRPLGPSPTAMDVAAPPATTPDAPLTSASPDPAPAEPDTAVEGSAPVEGPTPTRAPSPQWIPPRALSPLPAVPWPRLGGASSDEERDRFRAGQPSGEQASEP